ncbi:MAG TPA: M20/M25/M40 family metallo-hydrolase [Spirochaetia bacterium]|nr:M20/M25/M40 family metallo-hydrolase [Spirochaetia bacterium]
MKKSLDHLFTLIDEAEIIQVTRDLVAIPSIMEREGRGVLDYLSRWFGDLRIPVRIYPAEGDRGNFFADFGETRGAGRYMINGHQDTKPVDGMTIEPFGGVIREGRLYGRGACDMKGAVAAVLCAFKVLRRAGITPMGGITFYSDIEEEAGAFGGFHWAIREGLLDGYEGVISCEPTELEVHLGNRGGFVTAFRTSGISVHSGRAELGVNAIHDMAFFIAEYIKLPYLKAENPYFGRCTVNFEKIEGGLFRSAVPDSCRACVDSRLIPETPPEVVQREVHELMADLKRTRGILVEEVEEPEGWRAHSAKYKAESIPEDHELTRRVVEAVKQATGRDPRLGGCPGGTIAGASIARGVPGIICGPGSIAQAHTKDEWVATDQLRDAARIYTALMAGM